MSCNSVAVGGRGLRPGGKMAGKVRSVRDAGVRGTGRRSSGRRLCGSPPSLASRPLLSPVQADELPVGQLAAAVTMKAQAVSNQLQRLADLGIVASRREGNSICYRLVDLCVRSLLEQGLCLMEESLAGCRDQEGCC
jgi:DNA-binding transcriptional ArsR family regulator